MEQRVIYTKNKNAYVSIKDWILVFKIPQKLKGNKYILNQLLDSSEKLKKKYDKKTEITWIEEKDVLLFGERISIDELWLKSSKKITEFLRQELYEYSFPLVQQYTDILWKKVNKLTIRKVKAKRGSCSSKNEIMLNLSLVHLPTKYIKYVIIHEVCHLKHRHHKKSFRDEVELLLPEYKSIRKEMKNFIIK